MKLLLRLEQIRSLEEAIAEAALIASRREAAAAAARLARMQRREGQLRDHVCSAVLDGDPDAVYLSALELTSMLAKLPEAQRTAAEKEVVRSGNEAAYLAVRSDRSILGELLAVEQKREAELDIRREQKMLDEAFSRGGRGRAVGGSDLHPPASPLRTSLPGLGRGRRAGDKDLDEHRVGAKSCDAEMSEGLSEDLSSEAS